MRFEHDIEVFREYKALVMFSEILETKGLCRRVTRRSTNPPGRAPAKNSDRAPLAFADMNDHALTADAANLEADCLRTPCARGMQRHEQDVVQATLGGIDQPRDLFLAKHLRKVECFLGVGRFRRIPWPVQSFDIKESQGGEPLIDSIRR